jgi:hypothetical protein
MHMHAVLGGRILVIVNQGASRSRIQFPPSGQLSFAICILSSALRTCFQLQSGFESIRGDALDGCWYRNTSLWYSNARRRKIFPDIAADVLFLLQKVDNGLII